MEHGLVSTKTIQKIVPLSSVWSDTSTICGPVLEPGEMHDTAPFIATLGLEDDRKIFVCHSIVQTERTGVAEAFIAALRRPKAISGLTALLLQYPALVEGEKTRALPINRYLDALNDLRIESLSILYKIDEPEQVKRFLRENTAVLNILFEIYEKIQTIFHDYSSGVLIEYHRDREEDSDGLTVVVETVLSPEEGLRLLDRFDQEWWLAQSFKVRQHVTVMIL